jgi:hypothetical protein
MQEGKEDDGKDKQQLVKTSTLSHFFNPDGKATTRIPNTIFGKNQLRFFK